MWAMEGSKAGAVLLGIPPGGLIAGSGLMEGGCYLAGD